ncbi:zinc-binding dehydrogenase [Paenibacillus glycanilyticus]|uniref:zinc-binding dehydrogenase n=1 Tax=Paenibacillus glycanilyticus TaxID=126569 RepID=UPI000FDC4F1D|nr:zinc-binding dehydrogenase [Paenibacillus glycanilyticus]
MKALLLHGKNQWIPLPSAGKGEIVVEVHAAGLNPVDYKTAAGGNPNWSYPHILGLDAAGIIHEIGEGVTGWNKGDRVVYHGDLNKKGAYAEYAVTTAHTVSRIPEGVSFEEAAALPTAGYTAYQVLHRKLPLQVIRTILIHAGAGGVGGFAIQLAKLAGLTVLSTASARNFEAVKALGADHVIDYQTENVYDRVMELTRGRGVDAVVDPVGRDNATASLDLIAYNGHIAHIAGTPDYTRIKPFTKTISYHEIALNAAHHHNDPISETDLAVIGHEMLSLLEQKKLSPMLSRIISLEEVPQALAALSERHVQGKIVTKLK